MARSRQEAEWNRTSSLASWIHESFTGQWIDPARRNPMNAAPPKTDAQRQAETRIAMTALRSAIRGIGKKQGLKPRE